MKIYTQITKLAALYPKIAVSLGTFDGVHIGHRKIISRAVELAKQENGTSVVFTFSNHPLAILAPEKCPLMISSPEEKAELLAELGVDICLTIDFTSEFLQLPADDFVRVLIDNLNPNHVIVGPNYSYGYRGAGKPQNLLAAGKILGFNVEVHDAVYLEDAVASSTHIRNLILQGEITEAAKFLGRPFSLSGEVIRGDGRGRTLGFPTANLAVMPGYVVPKDGVYAVNVLTPEGSYQGVANIGTNPTFNGKDRHIEVNLFNYKGILYGKQIKVQFLSRIRGVIKFPNADSLKQQIEQDIIAAKHSFLK